MNITSLTSSLGIINMFPYFLLKLCFCFLIIRKLIFCPLLVIFDRCPNAMFCFFLSQQSPVYYKNISCFCNFRLIYLDKRAYNSICTFNYEQESFLDYSFEYLFFGFLQGLLLFVYRIFMYLQYLLICLKYTSFLCFLKYLFKPFS